MNKSNYLEEIAIKKAKTGNQDGFRYLLETYKTYAFTIAIGIVKNEENAEEVVQDAFIRAFKHIAKFKKTSKFSTWLYRIVYNTALTSLRSKPKIDTYSLDKSENYELNIPDNYANGFDDLVANDKMMYINT